MPELPEVEVLARHLRVILVGRQIRRLTIVRPKICRPTSPDAMRRALAGLGFCDVTRRGKYLLFQLAGLAEPAPPRVLVGHLGMTGRMFVQPARQPVPRHTVAHIALDQGRLVFQDARLFGRLTLDQTPLARLGPDALGAEFTLAGFQAALGNSRQAIKALLLDQAIVAGVGNIYASESLFRARIHPARQAKKLAGPEVVLLRRILRRVLHEAVAHGSTVPLDWSGQRTRDRLFYYGQDPAARGEYRERLQVYDREHQPCPRCHTPVRRLVQAGRSSFYCPGCQHR